MTIEESQTMGENATSNKTAEGIELDDAQLDIAR